jgi:hypothetical protein
LRGLPRLRALLAMQADDTGYADARDAAAALVAEATDDQRAGAAFLFPTETAWVRGEAQSFAKSPHSRSTLFLCSISDRDSFGLVAPHVSTFTLLGGYSPQDYLPSLLEGVGVDALVLLRSLAAEPGWAAVLLRRGTANLGGTRLRHQRR